MQARKYNLSFCLGASLALAIVVILAVAPAFAKDGRDFSGYYAVSNVQDSGGKVSFTLTVQVFNNSDADVKQPVVALMESRPGGPPLGGFGPVKLMKKGLDVTVAHDFSVSRVEYERWQSGLSPTVVVLSKDASGKALQRGVQLSRRPALPPPGN